jgi:DNA polymerase-3 subunit delta'
VSSTRIVGQTVVLGQLLAATRAGTLAHATLLSGPEGVGKTTLAELIAAEALTADAWPGGLGAHPDHWLEDSDAERIGIDRVRAGGGTPETGTSLQDFFAFKPYAGGHRVAVIGRAERLTEQAANCVLKTLEEPPPLTHILLCAAHPERLPATILSRCQVFPVAPAPGAEVAAWLGEEHGVPDQLAALAARLSAGRPGRALRLGTAPGALNVELEALDGFLSIGGGGRIEALRAAERLAPPASAEGRERALAQVSAWSQFLRDVACAAAGAPELAVWAEYRDAAERWAEALPPDRIDEILGRLVDSADQLAQYAVPRLTYDVLFLDTFATAPAPPAVTPPRHDPALAGPAARPSSATPRQRPRRRA